MLENIGKVNYANSSPSLVEFIKNLVDLCQMPLLKQPVFDHRINAPQTLIVFMHGCRKSIAMICKTLQKMESIIHYIQLIATITLALVVLVVYFCHILTKNDNIKLWFSSHKRT